MWAVEAGEIVMKITPRHSWRYLLILSLGLFSLSVIAIRATAAGDPDLPGATSHIEVIPAGSLVIPMSTNLQALAGTPFNMKAYGLVNALLHANIPVKWAIKVGKSKDDPDFSASVARILPTIGSLTNAMFHSGPFIIHRDYTNDAMPVLRAWSNNVAVYRIATNTTVDVRYTIAHKPVIAVLDDGNTQTIQTSILDEAGISTNYYRVLHAADVAFLAASDCYTIVTSPHFDGGVTATNQTHSIRNFLMNGGNFLAQCAAVGTYENNTLYGHFHTTKGVVTDNVAKGFNYTNSDMAFSQYQGPLDNEGGAIQEWDLASGSTYTNGAYDLVFNQSNSGNVRAQVSKLIPGKPGSVVFYLGGHSFAGNSIAQYNGRRMYLNALFVPPDRPPGCLINFQTDLCAFITNSLNCITNGQTVTYTITVTNCGPGQVAGATFTDQFGPAFQNVTWTGTAKAGAGASALSGTGNINVTVDMPILSSIIYTVQATISSNAVGPIVNTATVTLPPSMTDADPSDNIGSMTNCLTVSSKPPPDFQPSCFTQIPAPATNAAQFVLQGGTIPPDQCGSATLVVWVGDSSNGGAGCPVSPLVISRTYNTTTGCGDLSSVIQKFTIINTNAPSIGSFPPDVTYSCANQVPPADDIAVTSSDDCGGGVSVTHDTDVITTGSCPNRFAIARTYHVIDACGNSISRTQHITVSDDIAPAITGFPPDATYSCANSIPAPTDSSVTATDNCGGAPSITHSADFITSSNCVNRFTFARTYVATDACGNSSSKTQTITVNGTTPPIFTAFPADKTYSCANAVPAPNDSIVTATNACGGDSGINISHAADVVTSSNCVNRFVIARAYIATDACGNSASRTQVIAVNGNTSPTITSFPADLTLSCIDGVPTANDSLLTATDDCGGASSLTITHDADVITSSNCIGRLTIARTYRVTDSCGNLTKKTQTITVNGTTAPVITQFPADGTFSCPGSVPAANDSLIVATNACGGTASVVVTHAPDIVTASNCVNRFVIARTFIATDACGNSSSKTQTITVNGATPPTITTFPTDLSFSCPGSVPAANDSLVGATDNCGGSSVTVTHDNDLISSSNCPGHFTITRNYRVTDACGNATSRSQTITVNDKTAPSLRLPLPLVMVSYSCASEVPPPDDSSIHAIDNCGGPLLITHEADAIISSNCVNQFMIRRVYHVADTCGNVTNFTQTLRVNSITAPTITAFPADATYICSSSVPAANDALVTAIDGCGAGLVNISHGSDAISSATCDNRYVIHRTYIAVDACGNSSSKTQTITINNTTAPTITAFPADETYSCASSVPPPNDSLVTATNACGDKFGMVISHAADVMTASNCVHRFTISRTYIATDACGNSASKTQTLSVNGTMPPTIITFPADVTFACAVSVPGADDTLVQAIDNCGASSVTVTHDNDVIVSNFCANHFIIARAYHVTDACGNATSKTQTITVNDTIAPEISCPAGFTVSLFDDIPGPNSELIVATDNCSIPLKTFVGEMYATNNNIVTITRTYAATDDCGNRSTCSQTITMNPYLAMPVANADAYSAYENRALNIAAPGVLSNDTDPNHLPLQTVLVETTTNGTLTLNSDGSFQYQPDTYYVGGDSFVYFVTNGGTPSAPVKVTITVIPVNQPPSFNKGANQIVNNYDSAQTRVAWATGITPGPANESAQTVNFMVSNDNNFIFNTQPAISPDGTLTYSPSVGHFGTAQVSVTLKDNGGTANGGNDTSPLQKFSIIVNNPPSATINVPTNTSLFLYPSPIDIIATAIDIDGTVTNVTFLNGTNVIGEGTTAGNNTFAFAWTNAPSSNSVLYALATDNYGATNLSPPITIRLGNPVVVVGGPVAFSPSLFSWGQKLSVTNPTISVVQSVTITFTSIQPAGTGVVGITGTNALGQPYITFNNTVPPVTGIDNYATILYVASSQPIVTFTTSASLSQGPGFNVSASSLVPITRHQFQNDGSYLLNFLTQTSHVYFVQYTSDLKTWFTSPIPLHGSGSQLQWIDVGPNTTESSPKTTPHRFYRVVLPQDK